MNAVKPTMGNARCVRVLCRAVLGAAALLCAPYAALAAGDYAQRDDVRQFIAEMAQRHGFARKSLRAVFRQVKYLPAIVRAMTPPAEAPVKSWQAYRALFVNRERVEAGQNFRARYGDALARAERDFGVPGEIIVAIIGVETLYGRNTGGYRVIDTLTTLAFDYPRRGEFFRDELEQFLVNARESGVDVFSVRGSYAGAIGLPQFMPGSFTRYAVDYDGDGQRDLNLSAVDAIGSVANFLKAHGWQAQRPIAVSAQTSGDVYRELVDVGIKPLYRAEDLPAFGVNAAEPLPPHALCALIELQTPGESPEYWVGLQNFYALTRYNRSSFYAAAVTELARAVSRGAP